MISLSLLSPVDALLQTNNEGANLSPTIPPAPASGVFVISRPATTPPAGPPCAEYWPRPEEAATLTSSQVLAAAADEIDWLYENTDDETDPECIQARANIEAWLSELPFEHQLVIALHHDATPWPKEYPGHEEDSFALVLHALWPSKPRDFWANTPRELELRARRRLELWIEAKGAHIVNHVIRRARWQFEAAVRAYAEVRGRVSSVVPHASAAFRTTEAQ
jgi:hypothetical protein